MSMGCRNGSGTFCHIDLGRLASLPERSGSAAFGSQEVRHGSKPYPAEKARAGEIILNTSARCAIFVAGPVGAVVLALVVMIVR